MMKINRKKFKKFLAQTKLPKIYLKEEDMLEDFAEFSKNKRRYKLTLGACAVLLSLGLSAAGAITPSIVSSFQFDEPTYVEAIAEPGAYNKTPIKFWIDLDNFSNDEIRAIFKAIKMVDDAGTGIKFEFTDFKNDANFSFVKSTEMFINNNPLTAANATIGDLKNGEITVSKTLSKTASARYYSAVMAHEILHILGLRHSHDPSSLLFPFSLVDNLSEEDEANLNTLYPEK